MTPDRGAAVPGLRERKKERTRQALSDAAVAPTPEEVLAGFLADPADPALT